MFSHFDRKHERDRQTHRQTDTAWWHMPWLCIALQGKLEGHSVERMYLWQRCFDSSVNKTIVKPRLAAAAGQQYVYVGCSRHKIPRSRAYTISEKAIQFRHPDCNPDRAQKLTSSSMSRHLSTRNISSKSMHAFLSNLANRQTHKQTRAKTFTSSFVGGKNSCSYCHKKIKKIYIFYVQFITLWNYMQIITGSRASSNIEKIQKTHVKIFTCVFVRFIPCWVEVTNPWTQICCNHIPVYTIKRLPFKTALRPGPSRKAGTRTLRNSNLKLLTTTQNFPPRPPSVPLGSSTKENLGNQLKDDKNYTRRLFSAVKTGMKCWRNYDTLSWSDTIADRWMDRQNCYINVSISTCNKTRGQSNLTKSASRGAHSPVRGHPRGSKVVPLNSWGRVSY